MSSHKRGNHRGVLERGIDILCMIASRNDALDAATIASELRLPVSSVYRILGVLRQRNLVIRGDNESGYRLGLTLLQWTSRIEQTSVLQLARPVITRLARETGETAMLALLEENLAVTADVTVTSAPVRVVAERGHALPLHAGASSKAILAYLPEEQWRDIVTGTALVALTPKTITDVKNLWKDRRATRARGYAISEGEVYHEACGVAAPIFDEVGAVIGSLAIAGPSHRLRGKQLRDAAALVRDGANTLNSVLGAHRQRRFDRGGMDSQGVSNALFRVPNVGPPRAVLADRVLSRIGVKSEPDRAGGAR